MKKIAFILAGCGIMDGSEIHESTCSLLSAKQLGCEYQCFSLDKNQNIVFNHKTKQDVNETRNMLEESARIARLKIKDINELNVEDFDILLIPGGRGVGYNLCNYFTKGENYEVEPSVKKVINEFHKNKKPICALCLAPMVLNKALTNISITIGNDKLLSDIINNSGNKHINTNSGDICIDKENKIITSPCYMLTKDIDVVYNETYKIVENALKLL